MSALAPVAEIALAGAVLSTDWGAEPELQWLSLGALRIDRSYQRDVLENGRATIRRIVESFHWSKFGQLVVARRPGGIYAIVDGQHRAIACAVLGIVSVPCIVIACSIEEEADAFAAINGNVTRPSPLQIHNARLVAGDRKARALRAVCDDAGVVVPRYAMICDKPGLCTAIGTLDACFRKFGAELLTRSLRLIVQGGGAGGIGMLKPTIIGGMCDLLVAKERPTLGALKDAIDGPRLAKLYERAVRVQSLDGGSTRELFVQAVLKAVDVDARRAA